ncbi:unnamed protein product [Auanema sp. JU1783]|nr:unnamed protein product [Auanema sp. JU1783]
MRIRISSETVRQSAKAIELPWGDIKSRMRLPRSLAGALYRTPAISQCSATPGSTIMEKPEFLPKKILILSKLTRYEFEKRVHKGVKESQLEAILHRRGSNYNRLVAKHKQHYTYLDTIKAELDRVGIESRVVYRWDYNENAVQWADCIMSAGGDGTFLMAASKIKDRNKPVIGINTDPQGSEGYMCLMKKLPKEHFRPALERLLQGDFNWLFRQRIRITVTGENNGVQDSIELHDQQLNRNPSTTRWSDNPRDPGEADNSMDSHDILTPAVKRVRNNPENITIALPVLALNEVFMGESLSSRVSYYEIQVNNGLMLKQKSSGLTICTGTGSTSWYFNINKLTDQCVTDLLKIVQEKCKVELPANDEDTVSDICSAFNQQLVYDPHLPKMAFSVRDPVFNGTFPPTAPRGFAERIRVKSRGYDAHLVVDGGVSYRFNDGSEAVLEVHEEDALKTVVFR